MAFANPLNWPVRWPRNEVREWPTFKSSMKTTIDDLEKTLDVLDCKAPIITTNQPVRLDGGLRTAQGIAPNDTGVALYFTRHGEELCIPCDKFTTVQANLRAIGLTLEYIKRMERYGTSEMVDAAFTGFKALPESIIVGAGTTRPWHEILEVSPTASMDVITAAYRRLLHRHHPDTGGDPDKFKELQAAYKQGKEANGQA